MTTTTTDGGATTAAGGGVAPAAAPSPPPGMALPSQQRSVARTSVSPQVPLTRAPLLMEVAIRCTTPNCSCDCFSPCKAQIRVCDGCRHGWVSHALDKLGFRHLYNSHQVELVQPSIAFDVASLMLYGTQAIPVRLKILLDRLFSVLQHEEVLQVLHGFGWTYEDYARGYIIQDPSGMVLDRWLMASRDEEPLILQQFLRFGETKTIAQQLLLQESGERSEFTNQQPRTESDIKKFIEKANKSVTASPLFKQYNSHIYNHMTNAMPSVPLPGNNKPSFKHSSVSSAQSVSPTVSSPVDCTSPLSLSPLNKLQNMQPYDFRQDKASSENPKSDSTEKPSSFSYSMGSLISPTTSVPNISISTSSLSSVSNVNLSSTYTTASSERSANEDGVYSDDDVDVASSAINLTRSFSTSFMDSVYAAKKVRHLRKSANPMKRRWNPTVLATLATNPATGKKRVQCHVCYKTFCDKGALKIHFSAVHLREMHKCTVEGCNMMFSSRRSRNRHSANPNPKLHSPNYRRKINPHDGRAANPYPIMPPSGIMEFTNGIVSYPSSHQDCDSSSASDGGQKRPMMSASSPREHCNDYKSMNDLHERLPHPNDDVPLPLTKKIRMHHHPIDNCEEGMDLTMKDERRTVENNVGSSKSTPASDAEKPSLTVPAIKKEPDEVNKITTIKSENIDTEIQITDTTETSEPESLVVDKDSLPSSTKGVRKRKSMNPIKCTTASDDDLQYVSTDDSSSDTYIDQDNDENGLLDSKSDLLSSDGSDSMNDLDDLDNSDNERDRKINTDKSCIKSSSPHNSVIVTSANTSSERKNSEYMNKTERYNGFSVSDIDRMRQEIAANQIKENEDISENPLRHLESLSLGAFTNMMNLNNRTSFMNHVSSISSGVSYHAPGLGLASVTTTTAPHRVESPAAERYSALINSSSSHPPPPPLTSSCNLNNSDTENSMSDQQMPLPPVYRDASMVGSVEIPVDKENPRRCTACGKIFQNHFGVKTHYQNVHLKLMHKCTVEGCNAAFPSKRSRDRHSANLNLHRKLLSTASDKSSGGYFDKGSAIYPFHSDAYRSDIFSPFYDPNSLPMSFADIYHSRLSTDGTGSPFISRPPFPHLPGAIPGFHPAFLPPVTTVSNYKNENLRYHHRNEENSGSVSSISNPSSPGPSIRGSPKVSSPSFKLEEDLVPGTDGRFACTFCEKKFHEAVVLQEHYEKYHTQALLQCSKNGCNKVFLSRQSRSIHSDSLHKDKIADAT